MAGEWCLFAFFLIFIVLTYKNKLMKTFVTLSILVCSLFSKVATAQAPACNYKINNNLSCSFAVHISYYDNCSSSPCDVQAAVIPPGTTLFSCNGCGTLCNVVVTIPVIALDVDINSGPVTGSPVCGGNVTMTWDPDFTDINP